MNTFWQSGFEKDVQILHSLDLHTYFAIILMGLCETGEVDREN
jgi:hypothetical protein